MTERSDAAVDRAIDAIIDGEVADWSSFREAAGPADRLLDALREVAAVARAHRVVRSDQPALETIGTQAPTSGSVAERWGPFELLEPLGGGAAGMVFRAWDTRLARYVALKLLAPAAPSAGAQALAEARLLARVRHPNVVTIHGADSIDGRVGLWMELIDGRTLERRLDDDGTLSATEAVAVGLDLCAALSAVHAAGLLHRDVKTQNVMRERGGRIVLMDFSAGHTLIPDATSPSPLTGTPMFMAPELFRGERPTPGSDVYSLGVVLFRLLTGRFPIDASTVAEVKAAHVAGAYRNLAGLRPGLPEPLAGAIARAIHPDPAVRFDSADTFADALRAGLGDPTRASRKVRGYSWQHLALAAIAATGLVTAGWLTATSATRPEPARENTRAVGALDASSQTVVLSVQNIEWERITEGRWDEVPALVEAEREIYRTRLDPDGPAVAAAYARAAYAHLLAGNALAAESESLIGVRLLESMNGGVHPLRAAALVMLAAAQQRLGHAADAAASAAAALDVHWKTLRTPAGDRLSQWLSPGRIASEVARTPLLADEDRDGLPDWIEHLTGLDPSLPHTRPGIDDGDADPDGNGWPARLDLALPLNPWRLVASYGAVDPASLAAGVFRSVEGSAATLDGQGAWRVHTGPIGYYMFRLPVSLRRLAAQHGFHFVARYRHDAGGAYAGVDLGPAGPRYDLDTYRRADGEVYVKTNTSVVPHEGPEFVVGPPPQSPLLEIVGGGTEGARVYIDRRQVALDYRGLRQFQETMGVFFGAYDAAGRAPYGEATFELVSLTVR